MTINSDKHSQENMGRKGLRHSFWLFRKNTQKRFQDSLWFLKRKARAAFRKNPKSKKGYNFAVLCVKKTDYIPLIVSQANSLHYFNPSHTFTVYTDDACFSTLEKSLSLFDYPQQIAVKNAFGNSALPWQYSKMDMGIEASRNGEIYIDADMVWHDDPVIDRTKPVMFAPAYLFKDNSEQSAVIRELFKKLEWLSFTHFVSAFVSIPPEFVTEKFERDSRMILDAIFKSPLSFLTDKIEQEEVRRTAEEIATCLALQSNFPNQVVALKSSGDKKDRNLLEPMYFGCENRILN